VGLAGAFGFLYFLLAYFVILGVRAAGLAVFWPPSGFATGVLIAFGPRARWPVSAGIVVAVVVVECFVRSDRTLWIALADSACDASEPLIIAGLINRYFGRDFSLDRVRHVLGLFIAMVVGTMVSSIAAGTEPSFLNVWWTWFSASIVGQGAIAPFIIGLAATLRESLPRSELTRAVIALVTLSATTAIIIWLPRIWTTVLPGLLLLPMLLWLAASCRSIFAAAGVLIGSLIVAFAAIFGIGHFGNVGLSIDDRIIQAQAAILFVALSACVLAALFAERRQNETRLAQANRMLERERDNKLMNVQVALASIAHEVRQPLAAIEINSHAARRWLGRTPPEYDEVGAALDRIVSNSQRTSEVFDAFRVLFGKAGQARQPIDMNEIVLGILQSFDEELKNNGVMARTDLTSKLPLISGHKGQLHEVVSNLVSNAIEAMIATSKRDRVLAVKTELRGGNAIVVSVQDSGPGIEPERLDSIFGVFVTTKEHGTGLGLAICRMIVNFQRRRMPRVERYSNSFCLSMVRDGLESEFALRKPS
jgi:signal transduction histidine kinase